MENPGSNDENPTISDVSVEVNPSKSANNPDSESNTDLDHPNSTEALAKALSSTLTSLIKDFDSKAQDTLASQDLLSSSIDRLTRELDQLLEDAPLPFIMQHAAKFSNVRKRVLSLNLLLKSIQRRVDNIDRMLSRGLLQKDPDNIDTVGVLVVLLPEGPDFWCSLHSPKVPCAIA